MLCNLILDGLPHFSKFQLILCNDFLDFISRQCWCLPNKIVVHFLIFMLNLHHLYFLFLAQCHSILAFDLCGWRLFWRLCVILYAHRFDNFGRSHDSIHFPFKIHILITADGFEIFHSFGIQLKYFHYYFFRYNLTQLYLNFTIEEQVSKISGQWDGSINSCHFYDGRINKKNMKS